MTASDPRWCARGCACSSAWRRSRASQRRSPAIPSAPITTSRPRRSCPTRRFEEIQGHDAILLGAIGDPRVPVGLLEFGIIARLRFGLDLYVNLRPVKLYAEHLCPLKDKRPEHVDFVVVRENTEDAYAGMHGYFKKGTPDEIATQEIMFTRKGIERVIRYAFELARRARHGRRSSRWSTRRTRCARWTSGPAPSRRSGAEYPDIAREHAYIDAACMWCVKNPEWFDIVVTSNMFGDIFTDLAAMIQGGLGVAASRQPPPRPGEPVRADPRLGAQVRRRRTSRTRSRRIMAVQMMLDYLGRGPRRGANRGGGGGTAALEADSRRSDRTRGSRPAGRRPGARGAGAGRGPGRERLGRSDIGLTSLRQNPLEPAEHLEHDQREHRPR